MYSKVNKLRVMSIQLVKGLNFSVTIKGPSRNRPIYINAR